MHPIGTAGCVDGLTRSTEVSAIDVLTALEPLAALASSLPAIGND